MGIDAGPKGRSSCSWHLCMSLSRLHECKDLPRPITLAILHDCGKESVKWEMLEGTKNNGA